MFAGSFERKLNYNVILKELNESTSPQPSISSTLNLWIFCTNVVFSSYVWLGAKNWYEKRARKTLMKLTPEEWKKEGNEGKEYLFCLQLYNFFSQFSLTFGDIWIKTFQLIFKFSLLTFQLGQLTLNFDEVSSHLKKVKVLKKGSKTEKKSTIKILERIQIPGAVYQLWKLYFHTLIFRPDKGVFKTASLIDYKGDNVFFLLRHLFKEPI